MLHFISNLSEERNLIVATAGSSFWLHWNADGVRYQAKAKAPEHTAKIGLTAYTVESLIEAAEAGEINWSLFWPEDVRGPAIERKDADKPVQAAAKGF
jgi:hypothetical protein